MTRRSAFVAEQRIDVAPGTATPAAAAGDADADREPSLRRARTAADYLASRSVSPGRVVAEGHGALMSPAAGEVAEPVELHVMGEE